MELSSAIGGLFEPYLPKQFPSRAFLGRVCFDYSSPFVELSCACWLLQERREPLHERVLLPLQGQMADRTARTS